MAELKTDANDRCITVVICGCGQRGTVYSNFALDFPDRMKVIAISDPRDSRRERMAKDHSIPSEMQFNSWEMLVELGKIADAVVVATPDGVHAGPAIAFAKLGYHILLEKPMAVKESECQQIASVCQQHNVILSVGHVLRYTPCNQKIKRMISDGTLGQLISIDHTEPVGHQHFAHSYVRGNWRREDSSSFSLMAKSCHDIDLIRWWVGGDDNPCTQISSMGSLAFFKKSRKPAEAGSAVRCVDCGHQSACPYAATRMYLDPVKADPSALSRWPVNVIVDQPDIESVAEALRDGPYGRCVFESDNDVIDNQHVTMQFRQGETASFHMVAFTKAQCQRTTTIYGSLGELHSPDGIRLVHHDFVSGRTHNYSLGLDMLPAHTRLTGHDGADFYLMDCFVKAVARNDPSWVLTGPQDALGSHSLVFLAERARRENRQINLES